MYAGPLPEIAVKGSNNFSLLSQYTLPKDRNRSSIITLFFEIEIHQCSC